MTNKKSAQAAGTAKGTQENVRDVHTENSMNPEKTQYRPGEFPADYQKYLKSIGKEPTATGMRIIAEISRLMDEAYSEGYEAGKAAR